MTLACLNIENVLSLTEDRWFERGKRYVEQGRVRDLTADQHNVTASVTGTNTYRVRLYCNQSRLGYSCTCPLGLDGNFCKHCVAVAIAWLELPSAVETRSDLQNFLESQEQSFLVSLLVSEASTNRRLRERLELLAARALSTGPDLAVFKKAIKDATRTNGIDYYSMPRFARRIEQVITSLAELLADGHAKSVVELTEYLLTRLEKAIGEVDDSDGHFQDLLPEIFGLHHDACLEAKEDPITLARRIFKWETGTQWDFFRGAAINYADVFGPKGLKEYRRLAEELWERLPILKPGDDPNQRFGDRFRITSIMETLAQQSGDLDELIQVKKRDLAHPFSFLQIAELYRKAERFDEALEWAGNGASLFEKVDSRISDFLATEYHRRGRHDDAINLVWTQFLERPQLTAYQKLHEHSNMKTIDGSRSQSDNNPTWRHWREQAIKHIRDLYEQHESRMTSVRLFPSGGAFQAKPVFEKDHSLLVEIFLWEENCEAAWEEAIASGCTNYLWLQLADKMVDGHPNRAYRVYKELVEPILAGGDNRAYEEAAKLVKKMLVLASRLNCERDFNTYLLNLRVKYKRKRNFMKLLDKLS